MKIVIFLLGLLFSADALYCGATGGMGIGEGVITAIGIFLILWGTFYEAFRQKGFLRFLKGFFVFLMAVFFTYSAVVCVFGYMNNASGTEDYVIVPGTTVNGIRPSDELVNRLNTTVDYLRANNKAKVIVSGGKGKGENATEARVMNDYLVSRGIDASRIMLEEQSTSTYENFSYAASSVADGKSVFITSDYHVLRSSLMASLHGIKATHIASPSPIVRLPGNLAREMIAQISYIKYYIK